MGTTVRFTNYLLVATCAVTLVACDNGVVDPGADNDLTGIYVLRTINGQSLPYTWYDERPRGGLRYETVSGYINLRSDNTCLWFSENRFTYADGSADVDTRPDACGYTITPNGNLASDTVTLFWDGSEDYGYTLPVTYSGGKPTLTLDLHNHGEEDGDVYVFRK